MNYGEDLKKTLNHHQPDRLVLDFGGTAVTGIHCLAVKNLSAIYKLADHPVKVVEPNQMLGEIEEDLREAMGINVIGTFCKNNIFGFANSELEWKPFISNWGAGIAGSR